MKKEITSKKPNYELLDGKLRGQLKKAYTSMEKNMLNVAKLCYQLHEQDEMQFNSFVKNELNASKGTISKFIRVGEMIEKSPVELPDTYTKIYALNPVKEDIENFNEYFIENTDHDISMGSVRELNEYVHFYINDEKEDTTEESSEETIEESIEESSEESIEESIEESTEETTNILEKKLQYINASLESIYLMIEALQVKKVDERTKNDLLSYITDVKGVIE